VNNFDGINDPTKILTKRNVSIIQFDNDIQSIYLKKYGTLCNRVGLIYNNELITGLGTVSSTDFTAATGTVTWNDEFTFSFSSFQNQLEVGMLLKIGVAIYAVSALTLSGTDVVGCQIFETTDDFGTLPFEYGTFENQLKFSTLPTNLVPGLKIKVGTETVEIQTIETDYATFLPLFSTNFKNQSFQISEFELFAEVPQITTAAVSENLNKNSINGVINVFNYYPKA
jgi:hypothetical protein